MGCVLRRKSTKADDNEKVYSPSVGEIKFNVTERGNAKTIDR